MHIIDKMSSPITNCAEQYIDQNKSKHTKYVHYRAYSIFTFEKNSIGFAQTLSPVLEHVLDTFIKISLLVASRAEVSDTSDSNSAIHSI